MLRGNIILPGVGKRAGAGICGDRGSCEINITKLLEFLDKTEEINPKLIEEAFWTLYIPGSEKEADAKKLLLTHPKTASIVQKAIKENQLREQLQQLGHQLVRAAAKNDIERVRSLLNINIAIIDIVMNDPREGVLDGRTALIAAAEQHNIEIMQLLIESGAKIEHKTSRSSGTALTHCMEGRPERAVNGVLFLLEHNARIENPIRFYEFLRHSYHYGVETPKVIECLRHLCEQLENRGIKAAEKRSFWDKFLCADLVDDSEVLREARPFLEKLEKNEKTKRQREEKNQKSNHHSFLHSMNLKINKKEKLLDDNIASASVVRHRLS